MMELQEDYWQSREDWNEAEIEANGKVKRRFAKIHDQAEDYSHYAIKTELGLKLNSLRGTRRYIHVRLETQLPRIKLTFVRGRNMLTFEQPQRELGQELGVVVDSRIVATDYRTIGSCQAWYYPVDLILVLWEVTLYESNKQTIPPLENKLLGVATV